MAADDRTGIIDRLNFRSLDGVRLSDGTLLDSSRFFRSAAPEPENLSAFVERVRNHRIRTIVDLRTTDERAQSISDLDPSVSTDWVSIPLFETIEPHWANPSDPSPEATASRYLEMLESGVPAIVRILELASDPQVTPVLIHCAKGRDRTGIVIASILMLLGADLDSVSHDYRVFPSSGTDEPKPQREAILELFKLIRIRYGSILDMLSVISGRAIDIQKLVQVYRG